MPKRSKRYRSAISGLPENGVRLEPEEAIALVRRLASAGFDETVEVATKLGVDPRRADQLVRGTVVLPHGTGRVTRVAVIAQGEKETEAREAGADYVGIDLVDKIKAGWLDFDA